MKRILMLSIALLLIMAPMAFAATEVTTYNNPKFNASSKVTVWASANATVFAAVSKHLNGTRMFGTSSDSTKITYKEDLTSSAGPGYTLTAGDVGASDSSAFGTSWSTL